MPTTSSPNIKPRVYRHWYDHKAHGNYLVRRVDLTILRPPQPGQPRPSKHKHVPFAKALYNEVLGTDIPSGYEFHHIDENPLNNTPNNILLLTGPEHRAIHRKLAFSKRWRTPKREPEFFYQAHLENLRTLANPSIYPPTMTASAFRSAIQLEESAMYHTLRLLYPGIS